MDLFLEAFSFAKLSAVPWKRRSSCSAAGLLALSHLCQVAGREQRKVAISIPRATEVIILMVARNTLSPFGPLPSLLFFIAEESPRWQTLCNLAQKPHQVCSPWGLSTTLLVSLSGNCLCCGQNEKETRGRPSSLFTATGEISLGCLSQVAACLETNATALLRTI